MHKKVNVSIKKRKNRKYLQARYRTSSGEWIEKSTKTTNRKEATAIGYEWAKAEMKEFASKQSKKNEVEYILESMIHDNEHMKLDQKSLLEGNTKLMRLLSKGDKRSPLMTLGAWIDKWFDRKCNKGLSKETLKFYKLSAGAIKTAHCGSADKQLMELLPEDIEDLVSDLFNGNYLDTRYRNDGANPLSKKKKKPSKGTAKKRIQILRMILDEAHENRYTSESFHSKLKTRVKHTPIKRGAFEPHELKTIIDTCQEVYNEGKCTGFCNKDEGCKCIEQWREWVGVIEMALNTGCRITNCIELDWKDVDLFNKSMDIVLSKQSNQDEKEISTFDINPSFHEYLLSAKPKSKGAVFPYLASKSKKRRSQLFRDRVLKKAGIKQEVYRKGKLVAKRSFHSTRGATATIMREQGIDKEVIKDILGHSCVEMTEHYINQDVTPEQRREAFKVMADLRQAAQ